MRKSAGIPNLRRPWTGSKSVLTLSFHSFIFHTRSTPSAFTQKLESRSSKEASGPSISAAKKKKVKKIKTKSKDSADTIDAVAADTIETVNAGKSADNSQIEVSDIIKDKDAPVASVETHEGEKEKPASNDAASLPESKNARKKRKRIENALMAEREAEAFDGEDPGKKKKRKKDEDSDEEEEEKETKKKKFVRVSWLRLGCLWLSIMDLLSRIL